MAAATLITLAALWSFFYSIAVPPWEVPDETAHFRYVVHLLTTRTLPNQLSDYFGEAHQPPLYYLLSALFFLPADLTDASGAWIQNPNFMQRPGHPENQISGIHTSSETFPYQGHALALHLGRGFSVLLFTLTIGLVIRLAWEIFPGRPCLAIVAASLVAFNPQFLLIGSAVNNDGMLVAMATGGWLWTVRAVKQPRRWQSWFILGVWASVALMVKVLGFAIGFMAGIALLVSSVQQRSAKLFIRGSLIMGPTAVILTGWWFMRNQLLFGDILGWRVYKESWLANSRLSPLLWADLVDFFTLQFRSFWGVFGWMGIEAPFWYYTAFLILCISALLGLARLLIARRVSELNNFQKTALALLALAIIFQELIMLWIIQDCNRSCYQGRYLFPVIGPIALFLAMGLSQIVPIRVRPKAGMGLSGTMAILALAVPLWLIMPAYSLEPLPKWTLWFVPNLVAQSFGQIFALKGYAWEIGSDSDTVQLQLYWQALQRTDFDYTVFVHLMNGAGERVSQSDQIPGAERNFPPTHWQPGDILLDTHILSLPADGTVDGFQFQIGVYDAQTGDRLITDPGQDFVTLAPCCSPESFIGLKP